jgi:hypothetical protein
MSCRNHTTVNIQRVYARLEQCCSWKAGKHNSERLRRLLVTHDFDRFAGLDRLDELHSPFRAKYSMEEVYESIFRESQEGTHSTILQIPVDALNSYQGVLISVCHFLIISAETRCCIDQPTIQIPFQVGTAGNTHPPPSEITVVFRSFGDQTNVATTAYEQLVESDVVYLATPPEGDTALLTTPSLASLLKEMSDTVADLDLIQSMDNDPAWKPVFQTLSSDDFGKILKQVESDFDIVNVAVVVATAICGANNNNKNIFTCQHLVADLRSGGRLEPRIPVRKDTPLLRGSSRQSWNHSTRIDGLGAIDYG